jgi:nucleotide-binding universal stress UspA family protein
MTVLPWSSSTASSTRSVPALAASRARRRGGNEGEIERQAEELAADGINVSSKIVAGPSAIGAPHMIADVARDVGADLIIVGTRGHTPLSGLMLGGVTQRLLHIASCPVLAVPPAKHAAQPEAKRAE